jgi:hypothetical protein
MTTPDSPALMPIAAAFAAAEARRAGAQAAEGGSALSRAQAAEGGSASDPAHEKAQAQADAAADHAAEQARRELEADRRSIRKSFKTAGGGEAGMQAALRLGRALRWNDEDIRAALSTKPRAQAAAGGSASFRPSDGYEHAHAAAGGGGDRERDPPPADAADDGEPSYKKRKTPVRPLRDDCPVIPLGVSGSTYHYLDPLGQLRSLKEKDHNAMGLRGLFGARIGWLWDFIPKFNTQGNQSGWKADEVAEALMTAAFAKGVFNPLARVRGVGGWRDDKGGLIIHAGDGIWINGEWNPPGEYGGHIYPADDRVPRPSADPASRTLATQLLKRLDTWNWRGQDKDDAHGADGTGHGLASILLLGWLASSLAGAGLTFRPVLWLTGDAGDGKTTLIELVQLVLAGGYVHASDATESGVSSTLGFSAKAVLLDEAEDEGGTRRVHALIKLARQAASGGSKLRGSSDHQAHAFNAKSSFLFGSIIVPSLPPADASRIMVLKLAPLKAASSAVKLDAEEWKHVGVGLRRRLIDGWARWAETFELYRAGLAEHGYNPRGLDQVGTLLAMADLMRHDTLPDSDSVSMLCAAVARERKAEDYQPTNTQSMLNHLLSVPLDVFRGGERMTIGKLIARAGGLDTEDKGAQSYRSCQEALTAWSIHVDGLGDKATVTLPYIGEGLRKLFDNTHWRGEPGVKGGWAQAMERLDGAEAVNSRRFGGRGWRVNIRTFLMLAEGETVQGGFMAAPAQGLDEASGEDNAGVLF